MHRDLDEVLASQQKMLVQRGETDNLADDAATRQLFTAHLAQVERFLAGRSCFRTLPVRYHEAVADPAATAAQVAAFLERPLDRTAMAQAVDGALYRNRASPVDVGPELRSACEAAEEPYECGTTAAAVAATMRRMSMRVLLLLAVLAAAAAAFWLRPAPSAAASPAAAPLVQWVATAHQLGIVGYRDPAVAVSPSGRLVAFSEGRGLRVVPIGGGVEVASALGEGQVRHLAWIDDRRVVFEDGGAAARWQMLDLGGGARPLWPTATLTGTGATSGMSLPANSLRQLAASPDGAWVVGMVAGSEGPGAVARAARRPGAVADADHQRPGLLAGVGLGQGDRLRADRRRGRPRVGAVRQPGAGDDPAARHRRQHRVLGRRHARSTRRPPTSAASWTCGGSSASPAPPPA